MDKSIKINVKKGAFDMVIQLEWLQGNKQPYYSITGKEYTHFTKRGGIDRRYSASRCGAIGDDFAKKYPQYTDIAEFHLRYLDGSPMHPFENGMYWLGYHADGTHHNYNKDKNIIAIASRHFMVTEPMVEKWLEEMKNMEATQRVIFVNDKIKKLKIEWCKRSHEMLKKYFHIADTFEGIMNKM